MMINTVIISSKISGTSVPLVVVVNLVSSHLITYQECTRSVLRGSFGNSVDAYCDMSSDHDGGGWIVIQRNKKDSHVSFHRTWAEYEKGFGDLHTEFWYGLEEIHYLTKSGQWEMRVDYQDRNKFWGHIQYNQFSIGSASEKYPLTVGGFTGVDTDYWFNQQTNRNYLLNGMKFSTLDNDKDESSNNCALSYRSGWWYNNCALLNMNRQPPEISTGISSATSVLITEIKIRPKDCMEQ